MMTDVDSLSCYINILIYCYIIQPSRIRVDDVVHRPLVYIYDSFNTCSNPRRITVSDTTIPTEASSFLP